MKYLIETDALTILRNLVAALTPFAQARQVSLHFNTIPEEIKFIHDPKEICIPQSSLAITSLLCRIISISPQGEWVKFNATLINTSHSFYLRLQIQSSIVVDEDSFGKINKSCKFPISVSLNDKGITTYEIHWPMERQLDPVIENHFAKSKIAPLIKGKYPKIKKRMRSHFIQIENKIRFIANNNPQDAIFLQKVDAVILDNLDNDKFNANYLSKSLSMSRTQLFRRLKKAIHESPAHYIRYFRLQKAKEMLETQAYSIGEIAFKTGFQSQSHFARVFKETFEIRPSKLRSHGNEE